MVIAYWLVGREIVEEEQQGEKRAEYGKRLIADLSQMLTERYEKRFLVAHLKNIRQFHLTFGSRMPEIGYMPSSRLPESKSYPGVANWQYRTKVARRVTNCWKQKATRRVVILNSKRHTTRRVANLARDFTLI